MSGKWMDDLDPAMPAVDAADAILRRRLKAVAAAAEALSGGSEINPKKARTLRVATRRAEAALALFSRWIEQVKEGDRAASKLRGHLRRLRHAAGRVRDGSVHAELFKELAEQAPAPQLVVLEYLIARTERESNRAERDLRRLCDRDPAFKRRRLIAAIEKAARPGNPSLRDAAAAAFPSATAQVRLAAADLSTPERLHELRLLLKRTRYLLELLRPVLGEPLVAEVYPQFQQAQDHLGAVNDADTILLRLDAEGVRLEGRGDRAGLLEGLAQLRQRCLAVRDRRIESFLAWWRQIEPEGAFTALEQAAKPVAPQAAPHIHLNGHPEAPVRLAAIDVGSNSTRLVIAEANPDGTFRILDDEKELSRLAHGLIETGELDPAVMDRAATVVGRLAAIAAGYNCSVVRAIATAAVRQARNGQEFASLVRARTGLELRIISAEEEARLAYLSASHAFADLQTLNAGVVDVGGGSTEIVLSSRGVIDQVCTLPCGAVSLTERFGGSEETAGRAFGRMQRWLRDQLERALPSPEFRPDILVGTGGTVTTLGSIAIRDDRSAGESPPASLRGFQVRRGEIRRILDRLRDCSLQERAAVPGLNAERADIIVAGVAIVRAVMDHLGARRLRVHDMGVREGLLITMVREIFPSTTRPGSSRLGAARRFARSCRYEEQHSERVAALAVQIFDALGPVLPRPQTLWSEPVARELLEAGAVLHDIGYIINYAGHHKHGYHLIVHSDLSGENGGFSRREVDIIANLARYHRRSSPKPGHPNFRALSEDDRTLVKCLSAILRVADGLDRTHTQNIRAVTVRLEGSAAIFEIQAEQDPATDAWGASRKSDLFKEVFGVEPTFRWAPSAAAPPAVRPIAV